jgi:hypothetical protein
MKSLLILLSMLFANLIWAQDQVLTDRLKQGGLNIFIRHAKTPGEDPNKYNPPGERPYDCSSNSRQLSDEGREQSKKIGEKIKEMEIPIGDVYSSGFCRCEETAKSAFGRATVVDWMIVRTGIFQPQLDKQLRSTPSIGFFNKMPSGKNNVFVGHAQTFSQGVIGEEFKILSRRIYLEEGEAVVIEPSSPPLILGKVKFY